MIKKSVFENEIIAEMQVALQPIKKKQGMDNLVKAADYLNSAIQIFEEVGMNKKADQVLRILAKIATDKKTHVKVLPSFQSLMEAGVTMQDLKNAGKGDALSKARVNTALRNLGVEEKQIIEFIGANNYMSEQEAKDLLDPDRAFNKINDWLKDPTVPADPNNVQPGETISFDPIPSELGQRPHHSGEELVFKSIAEDDQDARRKKHKPNKYKSPTSEQMVKNLKEYGSVFDLSADDGAADDLLNAEIDIDPLEVSEDDSEKTFEDTD